MWARPARQYSVKQIIIIIIIKSERHDNVIV